MFGGPVDPQAIRHIRSLRPIVYVDPFARQFILDAMYGLDGKNHWQRLDVQLPTLHPTKDDWSMAVTHVTPGIGQICCVYSVTAF